MTKYDETGLSGDMRALLDRIAAAGGTLEVQRRRAFDQNAERFVAPPLLDALKRRGLIRVVRLQNDRSRFRLELVTPGR